MSDIGGSVLWPWSDSQGNKLHTCKDVGAGNTELKPLRQVVGLEALER